MVARLRLVYEIWVVLFAGQSYSPTSVASFPLINLPQRLIGSKIREPDPHTALTRSRSASTHHPSDLGGSVGTVSRGNPTTAGGENPYSLAPIPSVAIRIPNYAIRKAQADFKGLSVGASMAMTRSATLCQSPRSSAAADTLTRSSVAADIPLLGCI
ncbi:uncharacterized protein BDZ99DRAFT_285115 [Mytilinidion resinicola]|uniref:Uncharacterized protein n=1 Tax=Mytilinidion resinicola TaxID=574789 RepID=A0A6A6YTZ0_9PEZI|nr:uncharacterized protein BDZ99DRAFT_285115 [Mytilinidion resinicola]KAF2811999.1 hypothetical protein BDZ99DRAFT_285115 [Mytilinidion resinicola]